MIDLESQSQGMRPKKLGDSRFRAMLAITSFIMHYPDENASPREDGDAIVFHDLGDGVLAILTK